jgi:sulfite exporter TauE/SafE
MGIGIIQNNFKSMKDFALIFSLVSLGFFGGFTHCAGMCGPFVLTQMGNRLQKITLNDFSDWQRLRNLALAPYHAGRIFTYCGIGFFCSLLTKNIEDFSGFRVFSAIFLLLAAATFLNLFFNNNFFAFLYHCLCQIWRGIAHTCVKIKNISIFKSGFKSMFRGVQICQIMPLHKIKLLFKLAILEARTLFFFKKFPVCPVDIKDELSRKAGRVSCHNAVSRRDKGQKFYGKIFAIFGRIFGSIKILPKRIIINTLQNPVKNLLQNPRGRKGFLLGIILGFIPCGLLYSALLIAATFSSPIMAAIGMLAFGAATFPALFLTALGGSILAKIPEFKIIAKAFILLNAIMLILMALKLIH